MYLQVSGEQKAIYLPSAKATAGRGCGGNIDVVFKLAMSLSLSKEVRQFGKLGSRNISSMTHNGNTLAKAVFVRRAPAT